MVANGLFGNFSGFYGLGFSGFRVFGVWRFQGLRGF